jgi:DNA-directed RNA polymerase specialized sigma24 family protein
MTDIFLTNNYDSSNNQTIEQLIQQLVVSRQQPNVRTSQQQAIVAQIVEEKLRSRPICRPRRGKVLFGVYQEIYEQLKQQLTIDFWEKLETNNLPTREEKQWAISIRNLAIKKVLDDFRLKSLGLAAQKYPVNSELRRYALGELIEAIRWSNRLCHPHKEKFSPQFYELIYEEAVLETLIYVCTHIDKYDPERGDKKFMNWVNFRLDKLVLECRRKFNNIQTQQLPSLKDLDNLVRPQEQPLLSEIVRQYIEEDPKDLCKKIHIKNHAYANFQAIALARFSGKSWEEISQELEIAIPTLSSFFQRCCNKLANQFRQELQN